MAKQKLSELTKDQLMEKYPNIGLKKSMKKDVMLAEIEAAEKAAKKIVKAEEKPVQKTSGEPRH